MYRLSGFIKRILSEDILGLSARTAFFLMFALAAGDSVPLALSLWSVSRAVNTLTGGIHRAFLDRPLKGGLRHTLTTLTFAAVFMLAEETGVFTMSGLGSLPGNFVYVWALYAFTPGCREFAGGAWAGAAVASALWFTASSVSGIIDDFLHPALVTAAWSYITSFCILLGAEVNSSFRERRHARPSA